MKSQGSQVVPKSRLSRIEENKHHLDAKPNNEVSARHELREES